MLPSPLQISGGKGNNKKLFSWLKLVSGKWKVVISRVGSLEALPHLGSRFVYTFRVRVFSKRSLKQCVGIMYFTVDILG